MTHPSWGTCNRCADARTMMLAVTPQCEKREGVQTAGWLARVCTQGAQVGGETPLRASGMPPGARGMDVGPGGRGESAPKRSGHASQERCTANIIVELLVESVISRADGVAREIRTTRAAEMACGRANQTRWARGNPAPFAPERRRVSAGLAVLLGTSAPSAKGALCQRTTGQEARDHCPIRGEEANPTRCRYD